MVNIRNFIFKSLHLIKYINEKMTLEEGDLMLTVLTEAPEGVSSDSQV